MWFFEKEESRWRKNPLLRCRRVCNGHNSCPRRSPRSCSSDEFFFNCRSFLSCFTSFTWWSLCPGSWAQWGRSWSRTSSRPPAPGPAVSATPFMQTLLIICKPIRGREGKGSSLKKRDVRWVKVSQQTWIGIKLRVFSYHTKKARVDLRYTSSEWSEFLSLKRSLGDSNLPGNTLSICLCFSGAGCAGQYWVLWQCNQSKTLFPYFHFMKQDHIGCM